MRLFAMSTFPAGRRSRIPIFFAYILCTVGLAIGSPVAQEHRVLGLEGTFDNQKPIPPPSTDFTNETHTLPALLNALDVLQSSYFEIWTGNWPTGIDWTKAVIGTYLSSALLSISTSFDSLSSPKDSENVVNKYFSQLIGSYFGQDAFALRQEAYDDMLWVVLGWLESVKLINKHSTSHYNTANSEEGNWYGKQYIPAFAHRARIFWEMASQGWDTTLCNGGMIWSPYLVPYKNAITNELYIAASISMYLYFPGDDNTSPFGFSKPPTFASEDAPGRPRDPQYLAAAIEAYKWLSGSNMTDAKGLYVDGYHVSGWSSERPKNGSQNTNCDARNEMVYTYNQGVLLSGQRGLYEATGARSYLEDGHNLVADVIAATGWDLPHNTSPSSDRPGLGEWQGLGRNGVLEEVCDAPGYCSQDSQTFKGIFFHHLTLFCARLPDHLVLPGGVFVGKDLVDDGKLHDNQCKRYGGWIRHNADAAISTKDVEGKFGMWWGAPQRLEGHDFDPEVELPDEAVDYRNSGVPKKWKDTKRLSVKSDGCHDEVDVTGRKVGARDLNDRGRGRTVETQGGGVAVLRALWEIVDTR